MNSITLIDTEPLLMRVQEGAIPVGHTQKTRVHTIAGDMTRDLAPIEVSIVRPHRYRVTRHFCRIAREYDSETVDARELVEVRRMHCLVDRVTGCVYDGETGICLSSCQMWLT